MRSVALDNCSATIFTSKGKQFLSKTPIKADGMSGLPLNDRQNQRVQLQSSGDSLQALWLKEWQVSWHDQPASGFEGCCHSRRNAGAHALLAVMGGLIRCNHMPRQTAGVGRRHHMF